MPGKGTEGRETVSRRGGHRARDALATQPASPSLPFIKSCFHAQFFFFLLFLSTTLT